MIIKTRVIPVLLLKDDGLVKTIKFQNPVYVGDPINTVRIFNEKEVDELVFLDITATRKKENPNFSLLEDIAGEAFMPTAYGGGITEFKHAKILFELGFEKIVVNTLTYVNPNVVKSISDVYGDQSVVASIDVKRNIFGKYELYSHGGKVKCKINLETHLQKIREMGVGEVFLNSINRDGAQTGYDLKMIRMVTKSVSIPVVACGGASSISDFSDAVRLGGASAVGAGSMFVFRGKHRAVLISYPEREILARLLP